MPEQERTLERTPAIRTIMLPKDTNAVGTIFGGVILSYIDLAGTVEGMKASPHIQQLVTVAMACLPNVDHPLGQADIYPIG